MAAGAAGHGWVGHGLLISHSVYKQMLSCIILVKTLQLPLVFMRAGGMEQTACHSAYSNLEEIHSRLFQKLPEFMEHISKMWTEKLQKSLFF